MMWLAEQERFQEAAKKRDLIVLLEKTLETQRVVQKKQVDQDIWGIHLEGERGMVGILPVRAGMRQEVVMINLPDVMETDLSVLTSYTACGVVYPNIRSQRGVGGVDLLRCLQSRSFIGSKE